MTISLEFENIFYFQANYVVVGEHDVQASDGERRVSVIIIMLVVITIIIITRCVCAKFSSTRATTRTMLTMISQYSGTLAFYRTQVRSYATHVSD